MKKAAKGHLLTLLALSGGAVITGLATHNQAKAQLGGSLPAFVKLQASNPGSQQTGNANLSGTVRASQFVGGGVGVTGVNADQLDGLDSTAFLTAIPNPLTLSGNQSAGQIIRGINSGTASDSSGVYGSATSAAGGTVGVRGDSTSTTGLGVYGRALSATGQNYGVWGQTGSTSGTGVFGVATSTSGLTYGVFGKTESGSGYGLYGLNNSTSGLPIGILGESLSSSGIGVRATGGSIGIFATGGNQAIRGDTATAGRTAILGQSTAVSGIGAGIEGSSSSPAGYGVWSTGDVHVVGDLFVSGSKGGYVSDIVMNSGTEPLEPGDVVEIVGYDEAVVGDIPVIRVQKSSSASSTAVLGPVDCALQLSQQEPSNRNAKLPERLQYKSQQYYIHKTFGAIPPGGHGRVVTLGAYKTIKVDASFGRIKPGDCLVTSPRAGYAMSTTDPKTGTVIGKALGKLDSGSESIPVMVQAR